MAGVLGSATLAADVNGDGRDDIVAGIPFEEISGSSDAGMVDVFYGSRAERLTDEPSFVSPAQSWVGGAGLRANTYFGSSVASGDFDGDGFDEVAIGAPADGSIDAPGPDASGEVHVIGASRDGVEENDVLLREGMDGIADVAEPYDEFGRSLQVGDFDGDGFDDLAISVAGVNEAEGTSGALHVIFGSVHGLRPSSDQYLTPDSLNLSTGGELEQFEPFMAAGRFGKGGASDLVLGLPSLGSGSAVVLQGSSKGLRERSVVVLSEKDKGLPGPSYVSTSQHGFGRYLAVGNVNGRGKDDLLVGVPRKRLNTFDFVGAVYAFYGSSRGQVLDAGRSDYVAETNKRLKGRPDSAIAGTRRFGSSLATGDIDGDRDADVLVGAPGSGGAVFLLKGRSKGLLPLRGSRVIRAGTAPIDGIHQGGFGLSVTTADLNGRSSDEILIGERQNPSDPGDPDVCINGGALHVLYPNKHGNPFARGYRYLTQDSPGMPGTGSQPCDDFGLVLGLP
jgi:hypothetical protein